MNGLEGLRQKPNSPREEKCMGTIHKTVSERGQRSILCSNKRWWKVQHKRRSVFQWKRGVLTERLWLRQKVLEPKTEDRTRFDGRRRLFFSAVAIENKTKNIANSCCRFHRSCAQPCQNLQRRQKNLCNARRIFRPKILQHIPTNLAHTHGICWSENLAKRSKHEILAPTVKLRDVLLDAGVW